MRTNLLTLFLNIHFSEGKHAKKSIQQSVILSIDPDSLDLFALPGIYRLGSVRIDEPPSPMILR